ncbi:MAG: hypothetical protein IPM58_18355 [Nitrospira sp.]|nr:hypothetical protein [Nitrospira sp.]
MASSQLQDMNDHEMQRVVQYVTARTSHARETVCDILETGFTELSSLATHSTYSFERDALLEYVSQWTIKRTGQPEPLVREVLACAGRWLDEMYEKTAQPQTESPGSSADDDDDSAPV